MGLRRSFIRYVAREAFSAKSLIKKAPRRGFSSLFDAGSALRNVSGGRSGIFGGHLDQGLWEQNYTDVIEAQADKAGNAGQETLLGPDYFQNSAKDYCKIYGEEFDPDKFISYVKNALGDTYYYAINIIIDECAQELYEAWDSSYGGDNIGEKLFGVYQGGGRRTYGSFGNALAVYSANAARNYGTNWNSNAAANARNAATASKFLAANPKGTARAEMPGMAAYRAAAARNGKKI